MYGLDLFSGIGGITKALEGYVLPVAYCENDRYAQAVLLSRMGSGDIPLAPIWDNIKTLDATGFQDYIEIIYGGFPCQDISIAGRGAGLAGERSGLFFEVARLVSEIRPSFVFLENVPAITLRGGMEVVGAFASLGYDCRWDMLSAYDVGAPHLRERWFLLAHSQRPQRRALAEKRNGTDGHDTGRQETAGRIRERGQDVANTTGGIRQRSPQRETGHASLGGQDVANADVKRLERAEQFGKLKENGNGINKFTSDKSWWAVEPDVGRVAHGIPSRVDRLRGLGNAVVPAQAREAFERLMGIKNVKGETK